MRYLLVTVALLACGCTPEPPHERTDVGARSSADARLPDNDRTLADEPGGKSFGIANEFSGKLSEAQERAVPESLRGAFMMESLQTITTADLAKALEFKRPLAEEIRDGKRYVALEDWRCVEFSDELSGQMIVIERYVVVPE